MAPTTRPVVPREAGCALPTPSDGLPRPSRSSAAYESTSHILRLHGNHIARTRVFHGHFSLPVLSVIPPRSRLRDVANRSQELFAGHPLVNVRLIFCVICWPSSNSRRPSSAAICIRFDAHFEQVSRASGTDRVAVSVVASSDHIATSDCTRASHAWLIFSYVSRSSFCKTVAASVCPGRKPKNEVGHDWPASLPFLPATTLPRSCCPPAYFHYARHHYWVLIDVNGKRLI
jgi:hypothetical protein